jgi:hypothetical protein
MQLRIFTKIHQPMKNPLLKHNFIQINRFGLRTLSVIFMTLGMFAGIVQAQTVAVNKTECQCLNNATTATNGQYLERFSFNGVAGQVWQLDGPISGFYHPASLPPPVAPILYLAGTQIPEIAPGQFSIEGKRVSGQPWSVYIRNVNTGERAHVFSIQTCKYPTHPVATSISGDAIVCQSATGKSYALVPTPPNSNYHNVVWSLVSGGTIAGPNNSNSVVVNWGPTPGTYSLKASGVQTNYAAQPVGCNFSVSLPVSVIDPAPYTKLIGDFGNCVGSVEKYTLAANINQLNPSNITWGVYSDPAATIPASGVVITNPGGTIKTRTIQWPNTTGVYYIGVRGDFRINPTASYCSFTTIQRVDIVNEPLRPIACNNRVNITMNPNCELSFSPDQFLEAQLFPNSSYDIMIRDIEADTIIPGGTIGFNYVGKTLEVKVIHECSGNSCWSYVKIEDKSIPDMVCPSDVTITCDHLNDFRFTGFPVLPDGAVQTPVVGSANSWIVSGFDKCSNVTLSYTDKVTDKACTGPYSSVILRTWKIKDGSGNESSCSHTISVTRASLADVIMPNNWDNMTGPNPSLEACENWPKVAYSVNGTNQTYVEDGVTKVDSVPDPAYTGYPFGTLCMNASVSYTDKKILLCGTNPRAYKLVRKWKVIDYCADPANNILEKNQLITVMDTKAPIVTCPADLTTQSGTIKPAAIVSTKDHQCVGDWKVLPPVAIYDCMPTTWTIEFKLADNTGNPKPDTDFSKKDGTAEVKGSFPNYTIVNLPKGRTWVRYTVTDLCGNYSYCFTEIDVVDNEAPIAVCDKHSIIAIGANGEGLAGVLTFDDGSHDNCGVACMKVRRMDNAISWDKLTCNNQVKFTCSDIGKVIQVELGVWDEAGLFNSCMVEARVQDNIFPVINVPADVTANCNEDFTSLTRFGTATATDNCIVTVKEERVDNINECGLGTIVRTFTATDSYGNKTVKSQTITVKNNKPFTKNDILWPDTYTINSGCIADIAPDKLPIQFSKPRYTRNIDCSRLVANYEDLVFNFADNVCIKVLRKWTVIDWCQHNPLVPGVGEWTYTQLIMVNNTVGPKFRKGCDASDISYTQVGQCQAKVTVSAVADDDCTPEDKLDWSYIIDENNDGTIEVSNGIGRKIDRVFPYGTHKITWIVKDGCKNESRCSNIFTIVDDKKPTPYCLTEIGTVIMPSAKEVSIWASDYNRGSSDNCTSSDKIIASFSPTNRNDKSRTITCADMDGQAIKKFTFNVYFIDEAGNSDFCTVALFVQDNDGVCKKPQTRASVKGNIYTETNHTVENVQVDLMSLQPEYPKSVSTNKDGSFLFSDLMTDNAYTITPTKDDDILNGVSTLDIVMIQRHILGLETLNSPYKLIAADINNTASITASDLSELRKVILGIKNNFQNNKSWRFVDSKFSFADPGSPFPFNEVNDINNLSQNTGGKDFIAVKVGDVNESVVSNAGDSNEIETRSTMIMTQNPVSGKVGDIVDVNLAMPNTPGIAGTQFSFAFDPALFELVDAVGNAIQCTEDNFGYRSISDGLINFSWNTFEPIQVSGDLIKFRFKLKANVESHTALRLTDRDIRAEVYTQEGQGFVMHKLRLESRASNNNTDMERFEVFQNIPNPFNAGTVIGFNLPEASDVTFKVYDVTGKVLIQNQNAYKKGFNTINFDAGTVSSTGVLYYVIETNKYSATRKMIIIK